MTAHHFSLKVKRDQFYTKQVRENIDSFPNELEAEVVEYNHKKDKTRLQPVT
jgi:hypothetical protein